MPEFQEKYEKVSAWIDGGLEPHEAEAVELKMKKDPELKRIADELSHIKNLAKTPVPQESADLYLRVKNQVDRRYRKKARMFFRFPQFGYALGVMAGVAMIMFWLVRPTTESPTLEIAERQLAQAQQLYYQAIENMEQVSLDKLETYPTHIAAVYRQNLEIIDQSIAECERWAKTHPHYVAAYRDLTRMYEAKVELLRQILQG